MRTSDTPAPLYAALAAAQAEFRPVAENGYNKFTQQKYARLDDVLQHVRPILARHGLAVIQTCERDGDKLTLRTRLAHESGQTVESDMPMNLDKGDKPMQALGAALTYARRYALMSLLGVAGGEDDDAESVTATREPAHAVEPDAWRDEVTLAKTPVPRNRDQALVFGMRVRRQIADGASLATLRASAPRHFQAAATFGIRLEQESTQ
jgi:hypothetical protein